MSTIKFSLSANWSGGRLGKGTISTGQLKTAVSVPHELGGPGEGTNPEEMLLGAAATCYLITLAAILENRKLPVTDLSLRTEGELSDEGGLHFLSITHKPVVTLAKDATNEQKETARKAAHRAEQACMISKALRGNVELKVVEEVL